MSAMVLMTKAQVPSYLVESDFYKNLSADDDDEFSIPQEFFKASLSVLNAQDLAHLFNTMKFWGLSKLPKEIIDLLFFKATPMLVEEYDCVCKVLCEFDAEFGLLQLYQNQRSCTSEKEQFIGALQSGREDVLEYVSGFEKQLNNALIKAVAENGHIRLLRSVVDRYLKLSRKNPFKYVSIITVASRGHTACLRFLFDNDCKKHKDTCRAATENGHLACLKLAHERGCVLNNIARDAAASHGHLNCLKYIVEHGCPADMDTACEAARGGQLECLQFVLDQRVRILKRTNQCAAMSGNVECLKLLRARGAPAFDSVSAMHAASRGHLACLQYLLDEGCNVDHTATLQAAESGHAECLELLLTRKCEVLSNCVDRAAEGGHVACLNVLKKFSVSIEASRGTGEVLTWRSFGRGVTYARSLFEAGYPVPQCTLLFAVNSGNEECVEYICANKLCKLTDLLTAQATNAPNRMAMLKILHKYNCPWGAETCTHAAQNYDLESLKHAHEHGAPWNKRTTSAAIQRNGLACLEYLLKEDCPLSLDACDEAASRGLCGVLQLLHEHGCALTLKTCTAAATCKYGDCLTYAVTHGAPVDASICAAAATYMRGLYNNSDAKKELPQATLQVLECAHQLGCPWDERTCAAAAAHPDSSACLEYAHQHGCPWDASTPTAANLAGNFINLTYALTHGCPGDAHACVAAAERGNLAALQLLHEHHVTWDESVSRAAARSGCATTLRYCVENGCPIDADIMSKYNATQAVVS